MDRRGIEALEPLRGIEKELDPARFVRMQRSYIANLCCIVQIEPSNNGDARVLIRGCIKHETRHCT
ncbi:LytTR family transcriptional regulator DNA-binding domain-containing protein [Cognatilysobacter bugurensis]|uniref:LytTR family transcriptional regulator DNA-binding domain-containing protein n=1 Tax=Cognatilysobacter bugurensis TaxID=543356 RepID=UPI001673DD13